jgi:hypothetical protein
VIDCLLPLFFALVMICVGALALGFIADGLGKFRAPIRKAEESFDQQAESETMDKPKLYIVPNPIPHLRQVTEVYDQEKDL